MTRTSASMRWTMLLFAAAVPLIGCTGKSGHSRQEGPHTFTKAELEVGSEFRTQRTANKGMVAKDVVHKARAILLSKKPHKLYVRRFLGAPDTTSTASPSSAGPSRTELWQYTVGWSKFLSLEFDKNGRLTAMTAVGVGGGERHAGDLSRTPLVRKSEGLEVSVRSNIDTRRLAVGQAVTLHITMKNISNKEVSFWCRPGGQSPFTVGLMYLKPFGEPGDRIYQRGGALRAAGVPPREVVTLGPGEKWTTTFRLIPKLAGKAELGLGFSTRATITYGVTKTPSGEHYGLQKMKNPWKGRVYFSVPVVEVREAWKGLAAQDLEPRKRKLASSTASVAEKIQALEFSSAERTVVAVRFLLSPLAALPKDSPLRPFVVRQLAEMASGGYGYEAIEPLIKVAGDEKELPNVRGLTTDLLKVVAKEQVIFIDSDSNEGVYVVPKALQRQARTVLEKQ